MIVIRTSYYDPILFAAAKALYEAWPETKRLSSCTGTWQLLPHIELCIEPLPPATPEQLTLLEVA